MSRFSIRYPYFVIVVCLIVGVVGVTSMVQMPVDLFPPIKIPVVVVATFYSGMPPEQIEGAITGQFERMFTLAGDVDHIESRSLMGVSLIKLYFHPGSNPDSDVTDVANLAMATLRYLPSGTLPPIVMKFDASSLPVCLVTLEGEGLSEAQLHDYGQFAVRDQLAGVQGASLPPVFGGRYRQIMVYVDPLKLEAHRLGVMDVVRQVNEANIILPAGDVKIGPYDYNIYPDAQINKMSDLNLVPLKTIDSEPTGPASVLVRDIGQARDAAQIQYNRVRINGQPAVYLPVLKQGKQANTIEIVDGVRQAISQLVDVPPELKPQVVFDESAYVRTAISTLVHEGAIGLVLTGLMILVFLGSFRATAAVFLSIPLSALAAIIALKLGGSSLNAMVLGGLALAFSRLIDNSVIVLENIFRHLETGKPPDTAAQEGGQEVALPVLAATLTTAVVFFPVTFLHGVSKFLFSALAAAVVLALFASYIVAMSVVPLFCAKLIKSAGEHERVRPKGAMNRFNAAFNRRFNAMLDGYEKTVGKALARPRLTVLAIVGFFVLSLGLYPFIGRAYFPRVDPSEFSIFLKAPSGTRIELTDKVVARVEGLIRQVVAPRDLKIIVSNIGITPGFNAILNPNSCPSTSVIQVALNKGHTVSSFQYMDRVREKLKQLMPEVSAYFEAGGLVNAVIRQGLPAAVDIQVSSTNLDTAHDVATDMASAIRALPDVSDVVVPQDVDYPALKMEINRERASELGLSAKEVIDSLITGLTSDGMIEPSYWIDPSTQNNYLLTVQYPEDYIHNLAALGSMPMRSAHLQIPTRLDSVVHISHVLSPTEVDHYKIRRVVDVYVRPGTEALNRVYAEIEKIISQTKHPKEATIRVRGTVESMRTSFKSFGLGLILSTLLVYLVLVAQFKSFVDPFLILLAIPTGLTGVLLILLVTGTTLNVMSLMGLIMMVGIVVSNSILIVEFTNRLRSQGLSVPEAAARACRVRLRPVLMTSLATVIGLVPMALALEAGSETYAPLARAIIGGLAVSVILTIFLVPATYVLIYGKRAATRAGQTPAGGN